MSELGQMLIRIALGKATADEIRAAVDRLLADGVYDDTFIDIIDSSPPLLDEVLPPFRAFLRSRGVAEWEKQIVNVGKNWMKEYADRGVELTGDPLHGAPVPRPEEQHSLSGGDFRSESKHERSLRG